MSKRGTWYIVRSTNLLTGATGNIVTTDRLSTAVKSCKCLEPGRWKLEVIYVDTTDVPLGPVKETVILAKEVTNPLITYQFAYKGQIVEELTGTPSQAYNRLAELRFALPERRKSDYVVVGEEW